VNLKLSANLYDLLQESPAYLYASITDAPEQVGRWIITKLDNPGKVMTDPCGGELDDFDNVRITHPQQVENDMWEFFVQKKDDLDLFRVEVSRRSDLPQKTQRDTKPI